MKEIIQNTTHGELLDVVDAFGEPTGLVMPKKTIHDQGLPHRDVHVWITNGQDLLQQRRRMDKSIMPGEWDISVGGHVAADESYLGAAIRETQEELGLDLPAERFIQVGRLATRLQFPGWQHVHNIVGDNFVVVERDLCLDDLTLQPEEVMDARWYNISQLERDMVDPLQSIHAQQPPALYALGIAGMRGAIAA